MMASDETGHILWINHPPNQNIAEAKTSTFYSYQKSFCLVYSLNLMKHNIYK